MKGLKVIIERNPFANLHRRILMKIKLDFYSNLKLIFNEGGFDAFVNLASQILKAFAQILVMIYLARSLEPKVFGFFAFALGILIIVETLRDFGFTSLSLQDPLNSKEFFDRNFRVMTSRGILFGVSMGAMTLMLDLFLQDESSSLLITNLAILSAVPVVAGLSSAYNIHLWKTKTVQNVVGLDLLAFFTSLIILPATLMLQKLELAMASQILLYQIILFGLRLLAARRFSRYRWDINEFRLGYLKTPHLGYFSLLRVFTANLDTFLIGIILGPNSLGLYNRAFQVSQVPIQLALESQTNHVIRKSIDDNNYENISRIYQVVSVPVYAFLLFVGINAEEFLSFLYGERWLDASSTLTALCLVGILRCYEYKIYWVLLVSNQHSKLLKRNISQAIFMSAGILLGSFHGTLGVSIGIALALLLNLIRTLRKLKVLTSMGYKYDVSGFAIIAVFQGLPFLAEYILNLNFGLEAKLIYMLVVTFFGLFLQLTISRQRS